MFTVKQNVWHAGWLWLAVALLLMAPGPALPQSARQNLSAERLGETIEKIISRPCLQHNKTAVRVVALPSGNVVYDLNGHKPLAPASVQKLVTTASALHYLGPNYRFKTTVFRTGPIKNGVIEGDLVIRGGGDPELVPENIWIIARRLKQMGTDEVTGELIIDESFFDGKRQAPGWSRNHSQRAYDAPVGALSASFNTVAVHVYPGERKGAPLLVSLEPDSGYFRIINKGVTSARAKNSVKASRTGANGRGAITVTGAMPTGSDGKVIYLNVENPALYAGKTFYEYFLRAGVKIKGRIRLGGAPRNAKIIYTHKSKPLAVILRDLNKFSNNFIAGQVGKTISAEMSHAPGANRDAVKWLMRFLAESGLDMRGVKLADTSGLSRKNRIPASVITGLLKIMNERFDIGPDFLATLGIMGVDGSVKDRMKRSTARALARVKTGTLTSVSSLAGYVPGRGGGLFAFTIFFNDNKCYYKTARKIQDDIVTAVHKMGVAK